MRPKTELAEADRSRILSYYSAKADANLRLLDGTAQTEVDRAWVDHWADAIDQSWGADFYVDLFRATERVIGDRFSTDTAPPEGDDPEIYRLFEVLVGAFSHYQARVGNLAAMQSQLSWDYGSLVGRRAAHALPTRYIDLLRYAWRLSCELGEPNPRAAVLLANTLMDRREVDEAIIVWEEVLAVRPRTAIAIYELALEAGDHPELLERVQGLCADGLADPAVRGIPLAIIRHAAAIVEPTKAKRADLYRGATEEYSSAVDTRHDLDYYENLWRQACDELRKLDPETTCSDDLARTARRARHQR